MNYNIPLSKLEKLVNPFRDNLFDLEIEEKDIRFAIYQSDIFELDSDTPKQKLIKQIAYKALNYVPQEISINLSSDNIEKATGNIIQEGIIDLAAAIYRKEKTVVGRVTGEEKVISTLLGVDLNKPDNMEIQKITPVITFDWEAIKEEIGDSWDNLPFVISQIQQNYDSYKPSAVYELLSPLIKEELWEDINFYKELNKIHDSFICYIPKEGLCSQALVDYLIEKPRQLFQLWEAGYPKIYASLHLQSSDISAKELETQQRFKNNMTLNLEKIQKNIFQNKEMAVLLSSDEIRCDYFYHKFPDSIRYDFDVLDKLLYIKKTKDSHYRPRVNVLEKFPENYADDFQWVKDFLSRYSELLSLEYVDAIYKPCEYNKLLDKHINDPSKVKEIIQAVKNNKEGHNLYKILPIETKNDESVIKEFIDAYPVVFEYITKEEKLRVLPQVINNYNFYTSGVKIDSSVITKTSDKNVLLKVIGMGNFEWFFQKQSAKWHDDNDFLIAVAKKTDYILSRPEFKEKFFNFDKEVHKDILSVNERYFRELPIEKRTDPELALVYLQNFKKLNEVPSQLFLSKDFCLQALSYTEDTISKIPEPFWKHQDFALGFCKLLDNYQVSKKAILSAPTYVAQLFDAMGVKDNYEDFMSNYFLNLKLKVDLPEKMSKAKKKI